MLELPWELRRLIIIQVLQYGRTTLPSFSQQLIETPTRLRNCFDANISKVTNLYVPKRKYGYINGNGLQATNRQLRKETKQIVDEELKSGNLDVPFVLDVMIVKDIGIFPNWMSFPYQPEHLKKLTINFRIIRVGSKTVPDEWIEAARYEDKEYWQSYLQLLITLTLYAFGAFSIKQHPTQPLIQNNIQLSSIYRSSSIKKAIDKENYPILHSNAINSDLQSYPNFKSHYNNIFNAYRLPSASWITDNLSIDFVKFEYDVNNERIPLVPGCKEWTYRADLPPGAVEIRKEGRFYKPGCTQFGRDIFRDYEPETMWSEQRDTCREFICKGMFASYQLDEVLGEILCGVGYCEVHESPEAPYLQLLAHSVGCISATGPSTRPLHLVERYPMCWLCKPSEWRDDTRDDEWDYDDEVIERNLARELACDPPDEEQILRWRVMKSRKAHGWILEGD